MPNEAARSFAILKVSLAQSPPTVPRAYVQGLIDDILWRTTPSPERDAIVADLQAAIDRVFTSTNMDDSDAALALVHRFERQTARDRSPLARLLQRLRRLATG